MINVEDAVRRSRCLLIIPIVLVLLSLSPAGVALTQQQTVTPVTGSEGTPIPSLYGSAETGPVFVTDEWRVSVIATIQSEGINSVGLRRTGGKDWIVVVGDVTNFAAKSETLDLSSFSLQFAGKAVKGFGRRSSNAVARQIGAKPDNSKGTVSIAAGKTERVVWVYQEASGLTQPEFVRGPESVSLTNVLASSAVLKALPAISSSPSLQEAQVDSVIDGETLSVYLKDAKSNLIVTLLGTDAPTEGDCYGEDSANQLQSLASDTVWLEMPVPLGSSPATPLGGDQPTYRFVWADQKGVKILLNQAMVESGAAALGDIGGDTRYLDWLTSSQATAEKSHQGLWRVCTGPHGASLPTPTATATATATATSTPAPPTPTTVPVGTKKNPVRIGKSAKVGDWTVKVTGVTADGTELVMQENQFNDPPATDHQFYLVTISATYNGDASDTLISNLSFELVGKSAVAYGYQDYCGVIPNPLPSTTEVFQGGNITGNFCWDVKSSDVNSLVMFVNVGYSQADRIYFALHK